MKRVRTPRVPADARPPERPQLTLAARQGAKRGTTTTAQLTEGCPHCGAPYCRWLRISWGR